MSPDAEQPGGNEVGPTTSSVEYGSIGTRMIFENDRVRLWEVRLAAGERGDFHRHDLDHVLIQISHSKIAVESPPESPTSYGPYLEADVKPGDVVFMRRGGIETAVNVGDTPFHEIIVEVKD